jgi:hypothetical protein
MCYLMPSETITKTATFFTSRATLNFKVYENGKGYVFKRL